MVLIYQKYLFFIVEVWLHSD